MYRSQSDIYGAERTVDRHGAFFVLILNSNAFTMCWTSYGGGVGSWWAQKRINGVATAKYIDFLNPRKFNYAIYKGIVGYILKCNL